ncbi:MAG TPA: energy-coupling factor transporter transmembrane component T [Bacillota bacterium]|nr:energy-coupling factor transporter transmembrane component T [Bacillota bacterium]
MKDRQDFPDVRTLLAVVLAITSLAIAINDSRWLLLLLAITLACLLAAGVSLKLLLRRLRRYRWLFFFIALAQSLTNSPGRALLAWRGYVLLSTGGLLGAAAALLRIAIILAAVGLLSLKDYQQMVTGLTQMGVPYEFAFMVLLAVRFIPVLMVEFRDSLAAIELRGVDLKAIPLKDKLRVYSYLLMPTTAGALIRSRRIAIAMEARAFRAYPRRTWLEWPRLTPWDWLIIVLALGGTAGVLYLKIRGVIA